MAFDSAHLPEPGFQPTMIGFGQVVRVPLDGVQRGKDQLIQDPRISSGAVGSDLGWDRPGPQRPG